MAAFERAVVECLRSLVVNSNNKTSWDFCIVWKLGDDPSRFIEWRGCCCSGGNIQVQQMKVKEEPGEEEDLVSKCRDTYVQHPVRTEACQALVKFPSSIPLYSGIHGEVVMSKEPKWNNDYSKNMISSDGLLGTQVLVPVPGGLVELISSRKHVPRDEQIIDFIMAQCISVGQEARFGHNLTSTKYNSVVGESPHCPIYDDWLNDHHPSVKFPVTLLKSNSYPSIEGSSTGSSPPNDLGSTHPSPEKSSARHHHHHPLKRSRTLDERTKQEANICFAGVMGCESAAEYNDDNEDDSKAKQRIEKESYHSKNLITERNRRNRIRNGLFALRAIVPNISKMDMSSIVGDAIDYIQELQKSVEKYQDELTDNEDRYNNSKPDVSKSRNHNHNPSTSTTPEDEKGKTTVVEIEVNQIGAAVFLVRIICKQRQDGFLRLMQAMDSSGLEVIDVNITTSNGVVLNILIVEANTKEIHPNALKDSLLKLLC